MKRNANQTNRPHRIRMLLIAALALLACARTFADGLTATSMKDTYYLFEPITVEVTLSFDEPYVVVRDDPLEGSRQWRKLHRRLELALSEDGETLASGILAGAPFEPASTPATEVHSTLLACLGTKESAKPQHRFTFWDRAGEYTVTVRDNDSGLVSNRMRIRIVRPAVRDRIAAELFAASGLDGLLLLIDNEHGEAAVPVFQHIATEYPDSIYGKYAAMSVTMRSISDAFDTSDLGKTAPKWLAACKELRVTADLFDRGHPLRSRALLRLARLQYSGRAYEHAQESIQLLLGESTEGYFVGQGNALLRALRTDGVDVDSGQH